MTTIPNIN